MSRLADLVMSHRAVVLIVWVMIAVAGAATASRTVDALSYDFGLPGQPAYETNSDIQRMFGGGGLVDPLVLSAPVGEAGRGDFAEAAERVADSVPGTRVVTSENSDAEALVADDRAVALLYPPVVDGPEPYARALPALERAVGEHPVDGRSMELTGTVLLAEDTGSDRGVLFEVIVGGAGALVVLALVFASLLAGLPLLVAAVSILATYLALLGLTTLTDVSFIVQYLVALIGLGVAIDYSLLIVMRWREERAHGLDNDTAVRTALTTAGRSVVFSGITVAVSLAALVVTPLPFLRSIGLGGLLIPLLSVATAVTLVPVVLSRFGPRLAWPHRKANDPVSRRWAGVARWVVRRRWPVIVVTSLGLLAMTAPVLALHLGSPRLDAYGSETSAGRATEEILDAGIAPGVMRPHEVLVPEDQAPSVVNGMAGLDGVAAATSVRDPAWTQDGEVLLQVYSEDDPATESGVASLDRVRDYADTVGARVGGTPAEDADFVTAVYGNAPLVLALIVLVTFALLARALRSVWLPVKALVLNVLSTGSAYGLTVLIWQQGIGTEAVFGADASGAIPIWVPVAVFAFLFGLSMDYEVFILSRMREAYDQHGDTPRAVVDGIARTGRLVTSAALILFLAFVALSTVPSVEVKILATALGLGILIDALVVRALLAPALVAVLGRANWTMPRWLARVLRAVPPEQASRQVDAEVTRRR
ncbi:MMPL family transporter [Solicola gregarius]|uniref:MMPL family transporter n=1 Tax=Solicola gregarius TaxID=2908642 RepID=A0AA46TG76_9ACTN|nr:MMPL family transporter [Solicola gregarius]UYM04608.1 MMPL family transporter [Solicola gregarius]